MKTQVRFAVVLIVMIGIMSLFASQMAAAGNDSTAVRQLAQRDDRRPPPQGDQGQRPPQREGEQRPQSQSQNESEREMRPVGLILNTAQASPGYTLFAPKHNHVFD